MSIQSIQHNLEGTSSLTKVYEKFLEFNSSIGIELLIHHLKRREENEDDSISIVRLEQLYPFPEKQVSALLQKYKGKELVWVQEEPINMGYWEHLITRQFQIFMNFKVIARPMSASPATGFSNVHKKEQENIIKEALKK